MEDLTEKEIEQLRRLDLLRQQIQIILKSHIVLLLIIFALFLGGVLTLIYLQTMFASNRYVARISLHYYPKQPGKIRPYEERFLLQLFNRPAIRYKFNKLLNSKEFDGLHPSGNITVEVEKRKNTSFSVILFARTEQEAVAFTNGYARLCLQEYAEKRTADLKNWDKVLQQKKQDVFKQIQALDQKKAQLISPMQVLSPEKDFERLRTGISAHQTARTKLTFTLENLKAKQKRLQDNLKEINPKLLEHKQAIKEQTAELKNLEKEISVAQELYTEENPKLIALLSRRNLLQNRFEAFLKSSGLSLADTQALESAERISADLTAVTTEVEGKEEEIRVLDSEIETAQQTFNTLTKLMPRYQELNQQAASLRDSLQKLDESIAEINYLLVLIKDDLFITENATAAIEMPMFNKKNIGISIFSAVALTGLAAVMLALLEFLFGSVVAESEMTLRPELRYLGILPVSAKMFRSEAAQNLVFNLVCHRLQNIVPDSHVILLGALPGAKILPEFSTALEWLYSMAGKRVLFVDIVLADNADDSLPMPDTGIIAYSGTHGVLPISSKKYISPTEMELLKLDLATLWKSYDMIFFRHAISFRHDRLFLEQFIPLCDGLLIAVGLHRTPRKNLRLLAALQRETNLTVMTLLIDRVASHFDKLMDTEHQS